MKKQKLTLIELLISMAIFTIMISLLIKAFQVSTDTQSRFEAQTQSYDYARLAMSLIQDDLAQVLIEEEKVFKLKAGTTTEEYEEYDKSLLFFANTQEITTAANDTLLCFFKTTENTASYNLNYIAAVEYGIDTTKGLYRREYFFLPELDQGTNGIFTIWGASSTSPKNHFSDLSTYSNQSLYDESIVIPIEHLSKLDLDITGTLRDGTSLAENTAADNQLIKALKTLNFKLELQDSNGNTNSLRNFSRKISFLE